MLEIVTPEKRVVREEVDEVVCPGVEGEFGVLPGHTPFLTALKIGELSYRIGNETRYIAITWGYAEVDGTHVEILADMAETAEEIDLRRAEEAKAKAEAALRGMPEELEFEKEQVSLEKAIIRIQVAGKK
ncbi:MAG: F0F1 ATP synthase subunit epsilon [Nitrospirae bacterium]|nr:F0F1 ATP synthase subunit epsilon [Nitrospirota bacterium]